MNKTLLIIGLTLSYFTGFGNDLDRLYQKAYSAYIEAKYDSAVHYYQAFVESVRSLSLDSLEIVGLNGLGLVLMNNSQNNISDSVLNYSIELSRSRFGNDHVLTAQAYHYLSRTLSSQMNFSKALPHAKEGLRIREQLLGNKDTLVAESYNVMNLILRSMGQYQLSLDYAKKALKIWEVNPDVENLAKARTFNSLGWLYIAYGELIQALDFNLKSYQLRKKLLPDGHPLLARSLNLIGRCYSDFGRYAEAKDYYEEALRINVNTLGPDHANVSNSYKSLANLYARLGNYSKAISYLKEAIRIWTVRLGEKNSQIVTLYRNLASAYFYREDDQNYLFNIRKSLDLADANLPKDDHEFIAIYSSLAQYYSRIEDHENQYLSLKKALKTAVKKYGKSHTVYGTVLLELSDYFFDISAYEDGLNQARGSYSVQRENHGELHRRVSESLLGMGNNYMGLGQFEDALEHYHQSLLSLTSTEFLAKNTDFNPPIESISSKLLGIKIILRKGAAIKAMHQADPGNIEMLDLATQTFLTGISYIESLRNSYSTEEDKIQLYETGSLLYAGAIEELMLQYDLTGEVEFAQKAFEISEKSKAFVLLQAIHTHKAIKYGNVPDSLLERGERLEAERTFLKKKLLAARKRDATNQIKRYEKELFDNQNQADSLIAYLENNYNEYYQLKYKLQPSSIEEIQNQIGSSNTAIVEYFMSDDHLYSFVITRSDFQAHKQKLPEDFEEVISGYRKSLSDYHFILSNAQEANELFVQSSHGLYKVLIEDQVKALDSVKSLIVVPDGKIGLINFDALIQRPTTSADVQFRTLEYLLARFTLSYTYSATYLAKSTFKKSRKIRSVFGGYAPTYASLDNNQSVSLRFGESDLPNAKKEVMEISSLIGGDHWTGTKINKAFFKENATSYRINHLALHGVLDDLDPLNSYLAFGPGEDNRLTVEEIYSLKLDSDLIVLSACESGNGLVKSGEGNMSLSRAFNYAGAPSVVMSLWQTGDLESFKLMVDFYHFLLNGDDKAKSLQQAKLKYLRNTTDPLYSHPFFWAGFMLVGNQEPVELSTSTPFQSILLAGAALVILAIFYQIRKRRRAPKHLHQ